MEQIACSKEVKTVSDFIYKNILQSHQEELIQPLISIIHVFSCRIYGLRKYERKLVSDDKIWK